MRRPFAAISSASPRRGKSSVARYVPLTLAEYAIDFAARSVRTSASTEPMSGFGAPARTAMPIRDSTRSTREPASTSPAAISASSACAETMMTSAGSPRASRVGIESAAPPVEAPNTPTSSWPVRRSNHGAASRNGAVKAPDVMTTTSSAPAAADQQAPASQAQRRRRERHEPPLSSHRRMPWFAAPGFTVTVIVNELVLTSPSLVPRCSRRLPHAAQERWREYPSIERGWYGRDAPVDEAPGEFVVGRLMFPQTRHALDARRRLRRLARAAARPGPSTIPKATARSRACSSV